MAQVGNAPAGFKRFTYKEYLMGVDARIVVYAHDQHQAEDACAAAFERIAQLDGILSDYRRDSEAMKLCDQAGGAPKPVSPDLYKVLDFALKVSDKSGGMFDVTIGPLVQLWRKARKTGILPSPDAIRQARDLVDWRRVRLDPAHRTVALTKPGMRLDFGAIGKGYADDEAQAVLKRHGIDSALVEMGGDIVVSDPPPGGRGWKIEVPDAGVGDKPAEMLLKNCAISTSGDAEQFVVIGGVRYSHVVNPHSGYALTTGVEATLLARDGLTADPVSTAMTLVDDKGRKALLRAYPGTKVYVRHDK